MGSHPPKACSCARAWRVFLGGLVVALGLVGGVPPAVAQTAKAPEKVQAKAAQIDRNGVLILVRGTLLALDQANKTGNYTVLRDLGSANFQGKSAAELAEIFANHRRQGLDFGAVAVLEPQLTMLPRIEPNGMLHMAGFFPSAPMQVNFEQGQSDPVRADVRAGQPAVEDIRRRGQSYAGRSAGARDAGGRLGEAGGRHAAKRPHDRRRRPGQEEQAVQTLSGDACATARALATPATTTARRRRRPPPARWRRASGRSR